MMNEIKKAIDSEKKHLSTLLKRTQSILAKAPDGTLHLHRIKGNMYYYLYTGESRSEKARLQYMSASDKKLPPYIKKYCALRIQKLAEEGIRKLEKDPYSFDPDIIQNEYKKFESVFGELTPPQFISKDTILRRWQDGEYKKNDMAVPEGGGFITDRGETVRSKNEALCANCLNRLGIPYHYEEMIRLSDGFVFAPDFTIFSPKDSELYLLEILGMMSDPGYLEKNSRKIDRYARNGYIAGDKLLLFYEFSDQRFDIGLFEATVRKKFLE